MSLVAEIPSHPASSVTAPAAIIPPTQVAVVPPPLPENAETSETDGPLELPSLNIPESDSDDTTEDVPVIVSVALSTAAISFYTSLTFHLLTWGVVAVVAGWLGLEWIIPDDRTASPLMAALGEEDMDDELPQLDMSGEEAIVMDTPASTIEQIAEQLQKSDSGWLRSTEDVALKSIVGSESAEPNATGSGSLLKVPKSGLAVTKGSFTAFTIPANPKPGETYAIVIEVRLPEDIRKFRVADLSGEVKGSDRYTQKLPYDSRVPNASGYPAENQKIKPLTASTVLDVVDSKVQIVVKVPGAARLVKDTIKIRSRKLKEEQELTLVFGLPASRDEDEKPEMDESDSESKDNSPKAD
jgi:hypothetical protein